MPCVPCSLEWACINSEMFKPPSEAKCALCRLSPDNQGVDMAHYWKPADGKSKHPELIKEKRDKKVAIAYGKLLQKRGRDKSKRKVLYKAAKAEKITETNIIKATKNSGRSNKDGDHVSIGTITLDTKLQTTRVNPVIYLHELEKVRGDAMRSGKIIGGLVIRNKHNVGCVVISEADYALLTKGFK